VLQHEAVVSGCRKRVHEGHDVGVTDVLKIGVSIGQVRGRMGVTHPKDLDLSDKAHPRPVVDSAVCQLNRH